MNSPVEVHKRTVFTDVIKKKLGDSLNFPRRRATRTPSIIQVMTLMYHLPMRMMTQGRNINFNDYDKYINAEVLLPVDGEHMGSAKVVSRDKDTDGIVAGA